MAFDYTNLYPDTASNGSLTKAWNYTTLDTVATASAVGYFNKVYNRLGVGDVIFVAAVNSFDVRVRTTVSSVILLVVSIVGEVVTTELVAGSGGGGGGGAGNPAPPSTSVQFNDSGVFGGQANFTFVKGSGLVSLPLLEVSAGRVTTPDSTTAVGPGVDLNVVAGNGGATSGRGAVIQILAGNAVTSGNGGNIVVAGGSAAGGAGGDCTITAGLVVGVGDGGDTSLRSGSAGTVGNGGFIGLEASNGGTVSGSGGEIRITSGHARGGNSNGGDILVEPGIKSGFGIDGHIKINALQNFSSDNAATLGDVPATGLYRNGNEVRINSGVANEGGSIDIIIDGVGAVITTGLKGYLPGAPFNFTITEATLTSNAVGSVVISIWRCTYAQFDAGATHPVSPGDKITAAAPPTLSSASKSKNSTLVGWSTDIVAGDILAFNIDSVATVQQVALSLKYVKT